jgi:UDP-N-acetylglucosamine 2-epimerase (non-hydrolysing)
MKKVLTIFGTRPEAIKMAPVIKAMQSSPDRLQSLVCVTAQHRQMLDQVLGLFDIRPDFDLNIMKPDQDLFDITCSILQGLKPILDQVRPDLILVHGDTTTTMAAALAGYYRRIPVGHVEAGLRTGNKYAPFPEEINRKLTGAVADLHFAPTEAARDNLLREGVPGSAIFVTGNTVIDALFMAREMIRSQQLERQLVADLAREYPQLHRLFPDGLRPAGRRLLLVTGHRRESFGPGFENICQALAEIAASHPDVDILYPVHLNPNVQEPVRRLLGAPGLANVFLTGPVDYLPFVFLMDHSCLIITDSGGVQEEAPSLGKPVLVMRETTERPEAVAAGTVRLVGRDRARIVREAEVLLTNAAEYRRMCQAHNPYGDGKAAGRIIEILGREAGPPCGNPSA